MNRQEALDKIRELEKYISGLDKKPDIAKGQVYRHIESRALYMVVPLRDSWMTDWTLIQVSEGECGAVGNHWVVGKGFDGDEDDFEYVGMMSDIVTFNV